MADHAWFGATREDRYTVAREERTDYSRDSHIEVVMQVRGASQTVQVVIPEDGTAQAVEAAFRAAEARALEWLRGRLREVPRPLDRLS